MTLELSWPVFVLLLVSAPVGLACLGIGVAMWLRELAADVRAAVSESRGAK